LDFARLQEPFHKREIDVIFIASSWNRSEKNYKFVKEIASRLKDLNIHVVGEVEKKDNNATYHNLITNRKEMFGLLGNSKTIVSPSLFDAAPGILFEASAMGCNIVASKNCGNWMLCNEILLVDPFNLSSFLEKIHLSLSKKYDDNINYFFKTNSYNNFIETILLI
jgi:glycosyltransferase involved in cell wall biosynthesis